MTDLDWHAFCTDLVPTLLSEWGAVDVAEKVGADLQARAESFARSGADARDVLRAPFIEETYDHEPFEAPLSLCTAVCVVVRCSLLEETHAHGPVSSGGIKSLTMAAAAPLNRWLNENYVSEKGPPAGVFEGLDVRWPRAWTVLEALARTNDQGWMPYRLPEVPRPPLPDAHEVVRAADASNGGVVLSGIERAFDQAAIGMLGQASPDFVAVISSLSRLSRDLDKMMRMMEVLLARGSSILTTNLLIRPGEIHVRRGALVAPDSGEPMAALRDRDRLTGLHREVVASVLRSLDARSGVRAPASWGRSPSRVPAAATLAP